MEHSGAHLRGRLHVLYAEENEEYGCLSKALGTQAIMSRAPEARQVGEVLVFACSVQA